MKGLFIINPSSGKQNIDSMLREIMATLILDQICSHVDVFYTKGKDDAKNRAAELKPGYYDFIVSVGGDGTLNEVTNGLILSESNIPMAIISAGTVNDFATYMKLPQTADGFCQMIKDFQTKKVDVGRVNNEYFINVLAAGMLTDIAYKVPKDKKAVLGKMAYYLEGVKEFPKQLSQNMTLTFNSKEYSGTEDIMLFLVANSKSVGGFADAAPLASVSDGYLDVMIIKKMALLTEAPDLIFKLFQGEHPKHPSIEYFQTKELSVLPTEQTAGIAIDYDGEILEEGQQGEIIIIGDTVSTGYYKRDDLTKKAFFQCERNGIKYRAYHTGDAGYLKEGQLFYNGRIDLQVKLHGYRIEVEDIENNMLRLPQISHAVVLPNMKDGKVKSLTAFVTGDKGEKSDLEFSRQIKTELKEILPAYMVPKKIKYVDNIPMNSNGKADRKYLGGLL